MINSIVDTLNNLQNIKTPSVSGGENTSISYMDNKHSSSFIKDGFEKVYTQKTNSLKEENSIQSSKTPQAPQTDKASGKAEESFNRIGAAAAEEGEAFTEIISQAVDESSAESALDLTLARDINEIISELKEAAGMPAEEEAEESENPEGEKLASDTESETIESEDAENMEIKDLDALMPAGTEPVTYSQVKDNSGDEDILNEDTITLNNKTVSAETDTNSFESSMDFDIFETETSTGNQTADKTNSSESDFENILEDDKLKELNIESIEADSKTASDEGSSLMDNQSPQEQAVKAMLHSDGEHFDLSVTKTNQPAQTQTVQAKTTDITPSKIIEQITKQMEGLFNNSKVNIVLNPESLGRVQIQLVNSSDGLSAHFTVGSNEVKDLLMKGLDGLKDTLASHGVGVDNVSVKVSNTQKEADTPDWAEQEGSRGGNKGQSQPDREEKEKGLFEKMMAQTDEEFKNGNV